MTRLLPIWPGPRMPLNTREGVAEAPIEPGARTLCEPWVTGPRVKLWRLTVPWKPLPFETPDDLHALALLEDVDGHVLADLELAGLVAELAHVPERAGVGLLEVAEQRLVERASRGTSPNASWTAS